MKKTIKIMCLVLAVLMLMPALFACNDNAVSEETVSTETAGEGGTPSLKINGVALSEYTLVYVQNDRNSVNAVSYFNEKIGEAYGIQLDFSTEVKSGNEILFGLDGGDATIAAEFEKNPDGVLGASGDKIVLLGVNYGALCQVIDCLLNKAAGDGAAKEITLTGCEAVTVTAQSLKVMTYNILYDMKKEGRPADCREQIVDTVLSESIDVLGTQETTADHHKYLEQNLTGYSFAVGADEELSNYIYWKTDKFNLIKKGYFYMSDTPAKKSKYDGSNSYRTFTYAILEFKESGEQFLFVSVHADYQAEDSVRAKQLAALTKLLPKINKDKLPIVILGDFNTTGKEVSIPSFLKDNPTIKNTAEIAQSTGNVCGTLVTGGFVTLPDYVFDYIFVTADTIATKYYSVIKNVKNGKYPSDHLPVVAELLIY